jgi:ribosome biogenesis GTPase
VDDITSDLPGLGWDDRYAADFAAVAPAGTRPARVASVAAASISVAGAGGLRSVVLAGLLQSAPPLGGVTTGDWVAVDETSAHAVLSRRSELLRHVAGRTSQAQAVAANVDTVFIAVPLDIGVRARRVERSLAIAWSSGAEPVVLLTKSDLSVDIVADLRSARAVAGGATVLAVSAHGAGIDAMRELLVPAHTGAIIGPSGAGKSTLINALCGAERLATAMVRTDGSGRHTTTHRELVALPGGALLIDTPGMREMGVWDAQTGIDAVFTDILELAGRCRFSDCAHGGEPGCAVQAAAVDEPAIAERLESMRKLEREQRHQELTTDARLRAESRRQLKRLMRSRRNR